MKQDEKLQILVKFADGSIQAWGYDGRHFPEIAAMIADVKADFPDGFLDVYKNAQQMTLVWGEGLPIEDVLEDLPTREIEPACGPALLEELAKWLEDIGVVVNGN